MTFADRGEVERGWDVLRRMPLSNLTPWLILLLLFLMPGKLAAADGSVSERVRILYASTATSFAPIWIASDLGIYRKHGLDAEAVLLGGGPLIGSVLLSNSADIGVGVGETPIRVALQGGDMKIFALQKHARILSIVSKAAVQDIGQIKVLGIQSLGSSTHSYWLWYARQKKLSESQVQFVHTNSSAENYLALKSGRVDAAIFGPPFDVQAQQEGFRLLVEGMKNPQPFPATCYFATAGFLTKRPEAARRFVEAMKESVQLFHEDKTTTLKVIERRLRLQNRAVLERSYEFERVFMRRDLSLQYDVIDNALTETKRLLGAGAKRPEYTVDDVIDKSFVTVVR